MSIAQIVLLILGVILFVASFFVAEKKEALSSDLTGQATEEIRRIVKEETDAVKGSLQDTTEETLQYAIEKTERALERVTNEKMMAVSEYAETVVDDINKNHKEVLFLYDMLNEKQGDIKKTIAEAEGTAKKLEYHMENASMRMEEMQAVQTVENEPKEKKTQSRPAAKKTTAKVSPKTAKPRKKEDGFETFTMEEMAAKAAVPNDTPNVDMPFLGSDEERGNSNERILEMHRAGKSNMAIAKELGLGIGEVKIVIDLFEGTR